MTPGALGRVAVLPSFLPSKGWEVDETCGGYLRYNSRSKSSGIKRRARAHRVVLEKLLGRPLTEEEHVHHQDFDKLNCAPQNLIKMPQALNPSNVRRDPYTGEFMNAEAWERRYGATPSYPEWVVA